MSALITTLELTKREFFASSTYRKLMTMFLGSSFGHFIENGVSRQVEEMDFLLHLHSLLLDFD